MQPYRRRYRIREERLQKVRAHRFVIQVVRQKRYVGVMFVQQKMTMKDPKQAFLVYLMPAFMIFIFWSISSGLVLYWTIFNVLSIGQQYLINRIKGS